MEGCAEHETLLSIPAVILVCIQAVHSLDYFVSEAHRLKRCLDFQQDSERRDLKKWHGNSI